MQSFQVPGLLEVDLFDAAVTLTGTMRGHEFSAVTILPKTKDDAHAAALMLRRAARRLEEIGKGL
jgi:hypothetical protein